ncbi:MAG: hypothetical protein JWO82_1746 [Akkermansiaceae bacterium]|nr:hypothetical protein [Akkermansiaceae bacterium]
MIHEDLAALLVRRREIIADHPFRDRDTIGHLEALKGISEEIAAWQESHRAELPPRLDHFLTNCSFDKALFFLESEGTWTGH